MRSRSLLLVATSLALVLAAALTGCGGSSPSSNGVASKTPAQIVALAKAAAVGAASVHVAGSIVDEGQPISLNMELLSEMGGKGRITLGGLSFALVGVDRAIYVKGDRALYNRFASPSAARALGGAWLKASGEAGPLAQLTSLTDLGKLLDSTLAGHGTLSRGATARIGGQSAIGVTDAAGGGPLYVATTGTPYPLEIVKHGASAGTVRFDRWNQPVELSVPTDAINIKQLEHGR